MKRESVLRFQFAARVLELTGDLPDSVDYSVFTSPGWVHIIQRNPTGATRARVGWCTAAKLAKHLPRMVAQEWPK